MISPSLDQTWRNGLERVILGTLGIVGGFYFGWFFPSPWVGLLVTAVCSFLALAVVRMSFGELVGVVVAAIAVLARLQKRDEV